MLKQLQLILSSGIPILKGTALLERRLDPRLASICRRLVLDLQAGQALTKAMKRQPEFFPPLVVALTRAGEQSGELPQVLQSLVQYYTRQKELQGFLAKTLIYPGLLVLAALVVLCFFLLYVLPMLAATYSAMQAQPTKLLQLFLAASHYITAYPLGAAVLLCILGSLIYKLRPRLQLLLCKISWIHSSYLLLMEARFCKLLALLLKSGLNITEAVSIAGATVTDKELKPKLQLLASYLERGIEISAAVSHSLGLFSPLTEELLTIGAATGYLPQMLDEAAQIAENELQERLEKVRELLAPLLLLVAAAFTAGIVYAVLGPLFDLFTVIPEF